ncbi:MAG: GntR family transcriptional regulator [Syntrophobacteraceae bacterium]
MPVRENIPPYFKIYQKLKKCILTREFEKGSKIGALGELSKKYGVAPETMRRSIDLLEAEGLLITKRGYGTVVPESANLLPRGMGTLISGKKVTATFLESKVFIYSAEWVEPNYRFAQMYRLDQGIRGSYIYKLFFRIDFKDNDSRGPRGLMTHYFSEDMFRELNLKKDAEPYNVMHSMSRWLDHKPLKLTETIHPLLCVDEDAGLLDLPDGTPVFYQQVLVQADIDLIHFWDHISNANTLTSEIELNQNGI